MLYFYYFSPAPAAKRARILLINIYFSSDFLSKIAAGETSVHGQKTLSPLWQKMIRCFKLSI